MDPRTHAGDVLKSVLEAIYEIDRGNGVRMIELGPSYSKITLTDLFFGPRVKSLHKSVTDLAFAIEIFSLFEDFEPSSACKFFV